MKLYLAGNFAQLTKKENEMVMVNYINHVGADYNRLITYFFPKYCKTVFAILEDEEKEKWHEAYMKRLVEKSGITEEQAKEVLEAAMEEFNYSDNPEDVADEEISYWN